MKREVVVDVSVTIAAPPDVVWAELEQVEHHVDWMRDAVAIRFDGERRRGTGTSFACDTKVGPLRLTDHMEVTEWEPGTAMAVRHIGAVSGEGRFVLRASAAGTELTWREALSFPWWLGAGVGARVARPILAALWRGNLQGLRERIVRPQP
jgi:hypothetical protein